MNKRFPTIVIEDAKLINYCLSSAHPTGKHKAKMFRSRLGLTIRDANFLRQALLNAASSLQDQLELGELDQYGQRYILDFVMVTSMGSATIRSAWIVLAGEQTLRLATCYVL